MAKSLAPLLGAAAMLFLMMRSKDGSPANLYTVTSLDDLPKIEDEMKGKKGAYKGLVFGIGVSSVRETVRSEMAAAAAGNPDVYFVFVDAPALELDAFNAVARFAAMSENTAFEQMVMKVPEGTPPSPATSIPAAIAAAIGKLSRAS